MPEVYTKKPVNELTIEFDSHVLVYQEGEEWPWWIQNKDGEGMSVSHKDMEDMLRRHFVENF